MNIDSIFSQCEAEGVALSVGLGDNLDFYCSKKKISYGLKSQLKLNKPIIIEHLMGNYNPSISVIKNQKYTRVHADSVDTLEHDDRTTTANIDLKLSFEEIVVDVTMYRSVLEQTYIDADHDDWHRDGIPQKFRAGDHTYDEMKIALARFIQRVHGHEAEVVAAVIAFEKSQETLLEHQEYLKIQKMFPICNTPQLKKQSELAWQDCMRAYKKLPEYNALMFAKKRQAMFAALVDNEPSIDHIQHLINSLG